MNQAPNWNALEQMALDDLLGVLWGDPGVVRPIGVDHHVNALLAWPKAGTAVESVKPCFIRANCKDSIKSAEPAAPQDSPAIGGRLAMQTKMCFIESGCK